MKKKETFIQEIIKPLLPYLGRRGVVEIIVNQPGEVFLENQSGQWKRIKDPKLTKKSLETMVHGLANYSDNLVDHDHPVLSTYIPGYGHRFQAVFGAATESGMSISIRKGNSSFFPLKAYFGEKTKLVREAVEEGRCLLVSGGTSTGKTTCLNSLIHEIPKDMRIVSLENMREISIPHKNKTCMVGGESRGDDLYQIFARSILRLRPDRVIFGELTPALTQHFLRIANTGHRGSMTTVHAGSPQEALDALKRNMLLSGATDSGLEEYIKATVDGVIQMYRGEKRKITAEYHPIV